MGKSWDQYRLGESYEAPRRKGLKVVVILVALLAITILPALAAKGGSGGKGHGGGGGSGSSGSTSCTQSPPRLSIDNTWAWATPGSWGTPGQTLTYAIDVLNNDVGCGASSFSVSVNAADGFSVSIPTSTISLGSASAGYVWATVTSPGGAADGNYPLTASVQRVGTSGDAASETSYYKVYSTDTTAPKLFWMSPSDGGAVSGSTTYVGFASSDDHAVKRLEVVLDGVTVASLLCDDISYDCQVSYKWSIGRASGQHTARFTSTDWMGNTAAQTATFTVS
jgi:hypothetical protein